ncbi:MAG: class I SAM-dependent methyltransferase [Deltaproteobacteria bacterium]|nr:class I SAM-dependent methyltransferase [Deltaproteobacteria bacterium]
MTNNEPHSFVEKRSFLSFSLDETHYKVMELVSSFTKGKALDFPAGSGRLSWWLHKKGFQIIAGDSLPENFQNSEIPIVHANLNEKFPFDDSFFDYAFCIDGPEHVENMYHTFREFARILKPGGKMIISYPNYSNIESRLKMVFYGILEPVEPLKRVEANNRRREGGGHINRQPYALLRMALEYAGFKIEKITSEKTKKAQLFFLPLFLLIKLFTKIKGKKGDTKYWLHESNCYNVLMGGNDLILICTLNK